MTGMHIECVATKLQGKQAITGTIEEEREG